MGISQFPIIKNTYTMCFIPFLSKLYCFSYVYLFIIFSAFILSIVVQNKLVGLIGGFLLSLHSP